VYFCCAGHGNPCLLNVLIIRMPCDHVLWSSGYHSCILVITGRNTHNLILTLVVQIIIETRQVLQNSGHYHSVSCQQCGNSSGVLALLSNLRKMILESVENSVICPHNTVKYADICVSRNTVALLQQIGLLPTVVWN
jgi:hypothetical protein